MNEFIVWCVQWLVILPMSLCVPVLVILLMYDLYKDAKK